MRINNNLMAMNTHRQLGLSNAAGARSMSKLSSGFRINSAADDAAGLSISEKMRGQIRGLNQASRNAQDGISLLQTAEGALNETQAILQRMRELAVQSATDTNTLDDRREIQKEIEQLKTEVNRVSESTEFNTQKLLNGSLGATGSSSAPTNVEVVSLTGMKIGDYNVTIDTAATKASAVAGTLNLSAGTVDVSGKSLTINGVSIDFTGMTSVGTAAVVAKINEYTDQTGVEASVSTNFVKLDQVSFGSDAKIAIGGTDAADFGGAVTAGQDAVVTIENPDGLSQEVTGNGQSIIYNGAEFNALGTATSTATVTVTNSGATLHIGANKDQSMLVDIGEMSTSTLGNATDGWVKDLDVRTQSGANNAIKALDVAVSQVSAERSKLGAAQNRLDHTIKNLDTSAENLQASESRIRDVDMAKEMMEFTKNNILQQAAQAMLAQANQAPQGVLQLLR